MERSDKTLHEMVQEAASLHSARTAVTFDSCTELGIISRTYNELLSLANELTNLLKEHGRLSGQIFGLYCHPGINLPNWILGILQLPAAYAPLDPDSPPYLSIRFMDQCGLKYAVIQSELLQRFHRTFSPHLLVEVCEVWQNQGLTLVKVQQEVGSSQRSEQQEVGSSQRCEQQVVGSSQRCEQQEVGSSQRCEQQEVESSQSSVQQEVGSSQRCEQQEVRSSQSSEQQEVGSSQSSEQQEVGSSQSSEQQEVGSSKSSEQQEVGSSQRIEQQEVGSSQSSEQQEVGSSQRCEQQEVGSSQSSEQQEVGSSQSSEQQEVGSSQSSEQQEVGSSQRNEQQEVECEWDMLIQHGEGRWHRAARQGLLAYVLHTSGTTGLPKIVRVPHKCIVPNVLHLRSLFQVTSEDVVFMASPLTFDPSVVEMFLSLSSGACLLIVPTVIKKVPDRLATVLFKHHRITILQATPTLVGRFGGCVLQRVVLCAASSLRILALGGEACPPVSVLRGWRGEGNSTRFFNLYGTTEVSCWATCYKLHLDTMSLGSVPLGSVLMGTVVEVRGEDGRVITCGEGQVFIGGEDRVCFLGDEVAVAKGTMRSTGDWVELRDSHLYYLGRRDRLVKRHGQRLHLDALHQVLQSLPQVEVCAVTLCEGHRLVAFVVPSSSGDPTPSPRGPTPSPRGHTPSAGGHTPSSGELQREILGMLSQLLPPYSIPDTIMLLPALPLTSHGKVNMGDLLQVYERQRAVLMSHDALGDRDTLRELLQKLWKEVLSLSADTPVAMDSHFLLSGGDSLRSLRLCDDITAAVGVALPGLLEVILSGSFADLLSHVFKAVFQKEGKDDATPAPEGFSLAKRKQQDPPPTAQPRRKQPVSLSPREKQWGGFTVVRRAGEVTEGPPPSQQNQLLNFHGNTVSRTAVPNQGTDHTHSRTAGPNEGTEHTHSRTAVPNEGTEHTHSRTTRPSGRAADECVVGVRATAFSALALRVQWQSDTGRCVDASPVLLVTESGGAVAYVGSHSHRLQAITLRGGQLLWERVLGGRLEASAAITACGSLIAIGCYDGQVYFLSVETGQTHWVFATRDSVKSSPAVDILTALVLVGSHDGHMYALDPEARCCRWSRHCGGGAIFSSPCLDPSLRQLYVATLRGELLCLKPENGTPLWTHSSAAPFFSSPCYSGTTICIGSVDQNIYGFSPSGNLLWRFTTDGPVFSSPCGMPTSLANQRVFCGSHDGSVYCLRSCDGALVWRFQAGQKVFSSPFLFHSSASQDECLVAVTATDGMLWILGAEDGEPRASVSLPGEIFSSPVLWGRTLVVGCRNDFVYGIELTASRHSASQM
ncbi:beta-alanine-activating enzyme isoform X2 [Anguilla anguilla]|uniref:beta-alanine-activating enzyme isoform X2 n=1 Tax=Anguilla anguilla TaxID=7936 RepID=UPI0015AA9A25|nr:beta-alanine-activating enzyme isoform X2 [Anguilla anguilla]